MTELKTLKDFEVKLDEEVPRVYINREELKAEAVKWIKKMEEDKNAERLKDNSYFVGLDLSETEAKKGMRLTADWIKYFFNLTEEDLK